MCVRADKLSPSAESILRSMLNPDRKARLGVGAGGITRIKSHEFFDGLDWERVLAKVDAGPLPLGRLTLGETTEKWSPAVPEGRSCRRRSNPTLSKRGVHKDT